MKSSAESSMSDLERLLAEEGIDLGTIDEDRPDESKGMSARDWLIATSKEDLVRKDYGDTEEEIAASSPPPPSSQSSEANDSMSDLERLLAEEGIDLGTVAEDRPNESKGMSARDWLIATSDDELIRKDYGDTEEEIAASSPPPPSSQSSEANDSMSDLERLLAEEGIDLGTVAEDRPNESKGMSARDWLIATSDDELVRKDYGDAEEEQPPEPITPPTPVNDDKMVVDDDLPDWLQEVVADTGKTTPTPPAPIEDDKMVVEGDLPDWLQEVGADEPVVADTTFAASTPATTEDGLPDWLQEVGADEPVVADTTFAASTPAAVEDELPDWLQEVAVDEPVSDTTFPPAAPSTISPPMEDDKMVVEDDLPDWLQDITSDEVAADETLPSIATPPVTAPAATSPLTIENDDKMVVADDLPDWLMEETDNSYEPAIISEDNKDVTTTGENDLPDWLNDIDGSSTTQSTEQNTVSTSNDDLPDWLSEAQADDDTLSVSVPVESAATEMLHSDNNSNDEDLPNWLLEVQDDDDSTGFGLDEETETVSDNSNDGGAIIEEGDLPDWLQEVPLGADEPFEPSEPSPEPFADVTTSGIPVTDGELPDWLQEIQDETPTAELESTAEAEKEIPDWVHAEKDKTMPLSKARVEANMLPKTEIANDTPPWISELDEPIIKEEPVPTPIAVVKPVKPKAVPSSTGSGMPDWLEKLREGDLAEEDEDEEVVSQTTIISAHRPPAKAVSRRKTTQVEPAPIQIIEPELELQPEPVAQAEAEARLKEARAVHNQGNIEEAINIYNRLVYSGIYLDKIVEDMQESIKVHPTMHLLYQLMGDAMMRDGRLQSALNAYREAIEKL